MPCKLPDGSLPFDHGSNNGCVGNLWMQLPGSMPCKLPDCSLPFDHGSSNGSVGNLWMQSQGSMPCNFPDGSLPSDHGSNHGCDGNLRMQSEGPAPYTQPIDSFAAPSNESGLGGNLWMKPQQSGKVEGHGKPWMHVGFAHPHTPDRSRSTTAKEDENFAMAGALGFPKMMDGFMIFDQKISWNSSGVRKNDLIWGGSNVYKCMVIFFENSRI